MCDENNTILNAILIDIVEIIIVKSDDCSFLKTLQENFVGLSIKLNDKTRESRIKDKLAKVILFESDKGISIKYYLSGTFHREYDKPAVITTFKDNNECWIKYFSNGYSNRNYDLPQNCYASGNRYWMINESYRRHRNFPSCLKDLIQKSGINYELNEEFFSKIPYLMDTYYPDSDFPIYISYNGEQKWSEYSVDNYRAKNKLTHQVNINGVRRITFYKLIFDYIN